MTSTTITITPCTCEHCGVGHIGTCPRIKAIEYYENGSVKRVELREPETRIGTGGDASITIPFTSPHWRSGSIGSAS